MLIEYIVFGFFLAIGTIFYFLRKPEPAIISPETAERMKCQSPIERRLYDTLIFTGYSPRTQVPCGHFSIDIVLPGRIAIECDGAAYHSSPKQKSHDRKKDQYLRKNGYTVLRFTGRQINGNMKQVLKRIDRTVSKVQAN